MPGEDGAPGTSVTLNYALLRLNQTPIGRRYPVIAEPQWFAPDFLHGMFARRHVSMVVPITAALVDGVPGAVLWLDARQLAVFDNEDRRPCVRHDSATTRVELPSGEVLGHVHRYEDSPETAAPLPYDEIEPADLRPDADAIPDGLRLRAIAPAGTFDGFGQAVIRLRREDAQRLAWPGKNLRVRHVSARPITRYRGDVEMLARVLVRDDERTGAELDQVVREAIGVEIGEEVVLSPVVVPRRRWPDGPRRTAEPRHLPGAKRRPVDLGT